MFTSTIIPYFSLGPLTIRYYGLLFFIGFLLGYLVVRKVAEQNALGKETIDDFLPFAMIGAIIGIRLFHVFVYSWDYFSKNPIEILYFWQGGLSSHGAVIGMAITIYLFTKYKKIPFHKLSDTLVIGAPLTALFVRLGNFTNGEIVGKISQLPWAIKFPNFQGFRHPTMLYMASYHGLIFLTLNKLNKLKLKQGILTWIFIALFSTFRFLIEFTKDPAIDLFYNVLTAAQYWSLAFLIISLVMLYKIKNEK